MVYLVDEFCKLVLYHDNKTIDQLYNYFIQQKNDEEAKWMSEHFMLFVKAGQACRQAPNALKTEMSRLLKKERE